MALAADPPIPAGIQERLARWVTATLLAAAATLWIAMAEVDRLIAGLVNADGLNSSMAILTGPGATDPGKTWRIWAGVSRPEWLEILVRLHLGLDLAFAAAYGVLLWRLAKDVSTLKAVAVGIVAADVLEGLMVGGAIADVAAGRDPGPGFALTVITGLKWILLAVFLAGCIAFPVMRRAIAGRLARLWRVIWFHRLTAVAVALVAILALLPIPGVSDQMPDSQRIWAEGGSGSGFFLVNSLVVLLVALGLFAIGRMRSALAWKVWVERWVPSAPPSRLLWLVGPALLGVGLLLLKIFQPSAAERTGFLQFWLFVGIPPALLLASLFVFIRAPLGSFALPRRGADNQRALDMWRGGDALAVLLVSVSGMALVRTFAGPAAMMLLPDNGVVAGMPQGWKAQALALLGFGLVLALAIFGVKAVLVRSFPRLLGTDPRTGPGTIGLRLRSVVLVLSASAILLMLLAPARFSSVLGVSATAVLGIGSWALLFGVVIVWAQEQRPLEIFHVAGYRANPFLTLVTLALVLGQVIGGNTSMHLPRQLEASGTPGRHSMEEEFKDWLATSAACDSDSGLAGKRIRPMLLIAAEGGGIRATGWTTRVIDAMAASDCGKHAVLLSSGISGGSVGLVLATRYAPRTGTASMSPTAAAERIADPEALAASVGGTVASDAVGGATGLLLPNWSNGEFGWHDRAALMEREWESRASLLAEPFSYSERGAAGAVMLNSTVTGSGCRLVISQVRLPATGSFPELPPGCTSREGTPVSIDFFHTSDTGNAIPAGTPVFCETNLAWSTAAMLSARFPIISPAGRLQYPAPGSGSPSATGFSCDSHKAYQAIDGGYAEGSGLGTLTDIWGQLRSIVLEHNRGVESGTMSSSDGASGAEGSSSYVLPIFLYIRNSPGSDLTAKVPEPISELAVPLAGIKARSAQSEAEAWLQRLELSADSCPRAPEDACGAAAKVLTDILGTGRTVVAAPASEPSVDPPLGWTLSGLSRQRLDFALEQEKSACTERASLCSLLRVLDRAGS